MTVSKCPNRNALADFALGNLSAADIEWVTDHLEACRGCEATVAELDDGADTFVGALRAFVPTSAFATEPEFAEAIKAIQLIGREVLIPTKTHALDQNETGRIGEYELLEQIGAGGMATVYRARHCMLQRVVAIKLLPAHRRNDEKSAPRFTREIEAVGKLNHPNIVQALDAGEEQDMQYLVMELIDGIDLHRLTKQVGQLDVPDACEIVRQAALGVQHAHDHGLVHRDIKPSNLLLSRNGQVKVLDLGLALSGYEALPQEDLTTSGTIMGTLDYMAPEQAQDSHRVDIRADIYSLGCTLYKLLTGNAPFVAPKYDTTVRKIMAHAHEVPAAIADIRGDVSPGLCKLIGRMLAKDPSDRPQTPTEIATGLAQFARGNDLVSLARRSLEANSADEPLAARGEIPVTMPRPPIREPKPSVRKWIPGLKGWLSLAGAMLVLIGATAVFVEGEPQSKAEVPQFSGTTGTLASNRLEVRQPKIIDAFDPFGGEWSSPASICWTTEGPVLATIRRGGKPSIEVWRRETNRQWKKILSSFEYLTAVQAIPLRGGRGIGLIGEVPEQEPGLPLAIKCIPLNGVPETLVCGVKNPESTSVNLCGVHAYGEVLSTFVTVTDLSREPEVRLLCVRSDDGGVSWAEPRLVADGLPTSGAFSVAVDGDRMGCFFKDYQKDLKGDVWFVSTDDGGESWRKRKVAFTLPEDETVPGAMPAAAFADADSVSLVYLQFTNRGAEGQEAAARYAMISMDNQGTWSPRRWITPELPASAIVSSGAKAIGGGQRLIMSYRYALGDTPEQRIANQRAGKHSIQRLSSSDGGETWQSLEWKDFATRYSGEHVWGESPNGKEILFAADVSGDNENPGERWMYAQEFEVVSSSERRKTD